MSWTRVSKNDFPKIKDFFSSHGAETCQISSYLMLGGRLSVTGKDPFFINKSPKGDIQGVYYLSKNGLFLPYFAFPKEISLPVIKQNITTIMGASDSVKSFIESNSLVPVNQVDYLLLEKDKTLSTHRRDPFDSLSCSPAGTRDLFDILPLEIGYQLEEVLLKPENMSRSLVKLRLKSNLQQQIIYVARLNGTIIAKAGTNALGYTHNQLGGVYTLPHYRNKGLSTWLVEKLLASFSNKKACLFVKTKNKAAIKVYNKIGFETKCPYNISYFF